MKILSVQITNIASIERGVIDFESEPLKSSGLFAITGATGSGKSTILDAICLALYNQTPRLTNSSDKSKINDLGVNNVKNLLRKGAVCGEILVKFSAIDNAVYLSEWSVRRAYNKPNGKILDETIKLTNLSENQVFPEKKKTEVLKKIEQIIGMSFDEFTKSVILAQGDFTSFLKAKDEERSLILEKLTGSTLYSSISAQVYKTNQEYLAQSEKLNDKIKDLALLTDEEISLKNQELLELKQSLLQIETLIDENLQNLKWFENTQKLNDDIEKTKHNLNQAVSIKENQKERFEIFEHINSIQSIKSQWIEKNNVLKELNSLDEQITVLSQKQQETEEKKQTVQEALLEIEKKLHSASTAFDEKKQEIYDAKILDNDITKINQTIENIAQKIDHKNEIISQKQTQKNALEIRLQKGKEYVDKEENFQKNNADKETMYQHQLLLSKLVKENAYAQQETLKLKNHLAEYEQSKNTLQHLLNIENEKLNGNALSYQEILNEQNALSYNLKIYLTDQALAENIASLKQQNQVIAAKLNTEQNNLLLIDNQIKELCQEKQTQEIKYQTLEEVYNNALLQCSENVENLRKNLTEGKECPVCGATHHPFAEKNTHIIVDDIKTQLETAKKSYHNIAEKLSSMISKKEIVENNIHLNKKSLAEIEHLLKEKQTQIEKSEKYAEYTSVNVEEYLIEKIEFIEQKRETLSLHLEISTKISEYKRQIEALDTKIQLTNSSLTNHHNTMIKNHQHINGLNLAPQYQNLFITDVKTFEKKAEEMANQWKISIVNLQKYQQAFEEINGQLNELNNDLKTENVTKNNLVEEYNQHKQALTQLSHQRNLLLEGKNADEVEQAFHLEINQLSAQQNQNKEIVSNLNLVQTQCITNLKNLQSVEKNTQNKLHELTQVINHWGEAYTENQRHFMFQNISQWIEKSPQWIETERKYLLEINNDIGNLRYLLTQKEQEIQHHLQTNKPINTQEETIQQEKELKDKRLSATEKIAAINALLSANANKVAQQKELISQLNETSKKANTWAKLNELIGSADGKKFRKIAQSYTLDVLLEYANYHLKTINKRYTLQRIPDSLSLQVIDHDMGLEIRSVNSLSGGESFLVSLALALALSSLSTVKMNVETLFIDEGFGTLDANTLSIALDALENLQQQGKQVGVISHIQEMTERISVKIKVEKQHNGKSVIHIME